MLPPPIGLWLGWAAVVVLCSCATPTLPASAPSPLLGTAAPQIHRTGLDGGVVDSRSLHGKVVVVEFFAQYCRPCWRTLPEVQRLAASDPELVVVGIGEDDHASATAMMVSQLKLSFPVVHDAGNAVAARFRVTQIPTTFVLDRHGVIRWRAREGDGLAQLRQVIAALRREQ